MWTWTDTLHPTFAELPEFGSLRPLSAESAPTMVQVGQVFRGHPTDLYFSDDGSLIVEAGERQILDEDTLEHCEEGDAETTPGFRPVKVLREGGLTVHGKDTVYTAPDLGEVSRNDAGPPRDTEVFVLGARRFGRVAGITRNTGRLCLWADGDPSPIAVRGGYQRRSANHLRVGGESPVALVQGASGRVHRLEGQSLRMLDGPGTRDNSLAVSPDGLRFVMGSSQKRKTHLWLCDTDTGELVHQGEAFEFMDDLVMLDADHYLSRSSKRDAQDRKVAAVTAWRCGRKTAVATSRTTAQKTLVVARRSHRAAWSEGGSTLIATLEKSALSSTATLPFDPTALALSPQGDVLAIAVGDALSFHGRSSTATLPAAATCLAYDAEGTLLFAGLHDGSVVVIDPETARVLHSVQGHRGAVTWMTAAAGALWTSGEDGVVRIWGVQDPAP